MRKICLLFIVLFLVTTLSSCIRSRVVVRSTPSEAHVTMNDAYRGKTPITIPFGWYWFYDFEVEKEGYQTLESRERFRAPVWFYIPFDLVMEIMPFRIYDTKELDYVLVPEESPEMDGVMEAKK